MQDGTIYEEMKSYFTTITNADVQAGEKLVANLKNLQTLIQQVCVKQLFYFILSIVNV